MIRCRVSGTLLLLLFLGCASEKEAERVWIGHLTALSGPEQLRGEEAVEAMQLLLEQERELQQGSPALELGIRHVDVVEAEQGRREAIRLLAVNRVTGLLIGPGVRNVDGILATARSNQTPYLLLSEDPRRQGEILAHYALTTLQRRRASMQIAQDDSFSVRLSEAFSERFRRGGGVIEQPLSSEGVLLIARPQKVLTLPQDLPPTTPVLLGCEACWNLRFPPSHACHVVTPFPGSALPSASFKHWQKHFEKRWGHSPGGDALLAHDSLSILLSALQHMNAPSRRRLEQALGQLESVEGLLGTLRLIEGSWHGSLFIVRHQGDKAELVEKVPALTP